MYLWFLWISSLIVALVSWVSVGGGKQQQVVLILEERTPTRMVNTSSNDIDSYERSRYHQKMVPTDQYEAKVQERLLKSLHQLDITSFHQNDVALTTQLIVESMTQRGRVYHSMQHVWDVLTSYEKDASSYKQEQKQEEQPILVLSILLHDLVYWSIDGEEFLPIQQQIIQEDVIEIVEQQEAEGPSRRRLRLSENITNDPILSKVAQLFAMEPGKLIPNLGLNEFVSAVIGIQALMKFGIPEVQLLQIATCIEATIPFRPMIDEATPMDRLYARLKAVIPEHSEEWYTQTIQMACRVANYDLGSFTDDSIDRNYFWDSSWKLIAEARPLLHHQGENAPLSEWYDELLSALPKRMKFIQSTLSKSLLFPHFGNVPTERDMKDMIRVTQSNLDLLEQYVQVRQLQIMVLVEFLKAMGISATNIPVGRILPMPFPAAGIPNESAMQNNSQDVVRNWLVHGGGRTSFAWDPQPPADGDSMAAYLWDTLGPKAIDSLIEGYNNNIPPNQQNAAQDNHLELLKAIPPELIQVLAVQLGTVVPEFAEAAQQVPEHLGIS